MALAQRLGRFPTIFMGSDTPNNYSVTNLGWWRTKSCLMTSESCFPLWWAFAGQKIYFRPIFSANFLFWMSWLAESPERPLSILTNLLQTRPDIFSEVSQAFLRIVIGLRSSKQAYISFVPQWKQVVHICQEYVFYCNYNSSTTWGALSLLFSHLGMFDALLISIRSLVF